MSRNRSVFHFSTALVVAALLLLSACGKTQQTRVSFRMGEKMQVGPLIYSAMETQWKAQLGDMRNMRVPKQRFLLIKMTVTNSGGKEVSVPFLTIEDSQGNVIMEEQSGEGVPGWFGFLRTIQPAQTEEGWILFDATPNSYNLRVAAETANGDEQSLLIEIPLSVDSLNDGGPKPTP